MTSLVRFSPGEELRRMQREFDRLFDDFFPFRSENGSDLETAVWSPRLDLAQTDDAYLIHLDVPGMKKSDLNISYQQGVLTVSGERKSSHQESNQNYVRMERVFGHFYRSFTLPKAILENKIKASYEDGVL